MGAENQPLLPRPLTGGIVFDSMVSVIVTEANGAELYRSPVQYPATFSARDTVEAMMGGMQVNVALRPEMASKLVIGGRSEEHTSELQSQSNLVCRLLLEKKKIDKLHTNDDHHSACIKSVVTPT